MNALVLLLIFLLGLGSPVWAGSLEERIKALEEEIRKQQETLKNQQRILEELQGESKREREVSQAQKAPPAVRDYRLDDQSKGIYSSTTSSLTPYQVTKGASPGLMNPAISVILDTMYYHSTLSKAELQSRSAAAPSRANTDVREKTLM